MKLYNTLKELCLVPSVSGREENIRKALEELIAPLCDEYFTDSLGNLIALKKGTQGGKKIMLCAHMDEIGFLVNFIEDSGMIRVAPVGGIYWAASAYSRVISENGTRGVIVPESKTSASDYKSDVFYIDIGAKTKKQAEAKVAIGDFFVATPSLEKLLGERVCGRPLDDRIGCLAVLGIAEELWGKELSSDVYYVFSVQEEVGCRGSKTSAFRIAPDISLCFDVTATGDSLGASPMACKLGDGAAIKIKDSSVICDEESTKLLSELAKSNGIKHQKEVLLFGGTDTSSMQTTGNGSAAVALSIPTRYIHSGVEMCDMNDIRACIALGSEFVKHFG